MDLKQLLYFRAVAETGSISAAAARLRIAQPAVSAQILGLERDLGGLLFVRHARGVRLTQQGEVLLRHTRRIIAEFAAARQAVRDAIDDPSGVVRVGLPTTVANVLAAPLLDAVRDSYPHIELQIVEALSGEIRRWHADGRFDVAVLYGEQQSESSIPLMREDLYVMGRKTTLCRLGEEIAFSELANLPIYHTSNMHACRALLDSTAEDLGITLKVIAEVDSISRLNEMALRGDGVTIYPLASRTPESLRSGHFCRIVAPNIRLQSFVVPSATGFVSRASRAIIELLPAIGQQTLREGGWVGAHAITGPLSTIAKHRPTVAPGSA